MYLLTLMTDVINVPTHHNHPSKARCYGSIKMDSYDEATGVMEHGVIHIGQKDNYRKPYGFKYMTALKDFSSKYLYVNVNGNCCWKLFTRYLIALPKNKRILIKFLSRKLLQNLLYFYNKKNPCSIFHFE